VAQTASDSRITREGRLVFIVPPEGE